MSSFDFQHRNKVIIWFDFFFKYQKDFGILTLSGRQSMIISNNIFLQIRELFCRFFFLYFQRQIWSGKYLNVVMKEYLQRSFILPPRIFLYLSSPHLPIYVALWILWLLDTQLIFSLSMHRKSARKSIINPSRKRMS